MQHLHDLIVARPWVLAFWVFVIGSAIGSFLNVVIYRLPRGLSLSHPGSHCPKCGHAIRWYHNLPIAGWLLLRGKCHDCRAAISPRYPLVEFVVAATFVALAYVDVYLPTAEAVESPPAVSQTASGSSSSKGGAPNSPVAPLGLQILAFGAHAWVGCTLLAAALICWDGQRVPWRLAAPALLIAAVAAPFLDRSRAWPMLVMATILLLLGLFARSKNPRADARG
jgi:leader peptidase (prepilin peptidase)/N-methyltransferase